ncbi:MAG TPA: septum formation protein Maf [candidate division Zixibacteria bacterium]|nr:septum formation protein Maf [candidate division Zixibacteria bacterium]
MRPLYLASDSPRRSELLARVGIPFEKISRREVLDIPPFDPLTPERYAVELAVRKARSGLPPAPGLVLGCDTIVVQQGRLLEKPATDDVAREYLRLLQGSTHTVITGIALLDTPDGRIEADFEATDVLFAPMTAEEIDAYIATGEPMDKAGAYGIQEKGALLVREIRGDYFNVVGLPLFRLTALLHRFSIKRLEIVSKANSLNNIL